MSDCTCIFPGVFPPSPFCQPCQACLNGLSEKPSNVVQLKSHAPNFNQVNQGIIEMLETHLEMAKRGQLKYLLITGRSSTNRQLMAISTPHDIVDAIGCCHVSAAQLIDHLKKANT